MIAATPIQCSLGTHTTCNHIQCDRCRTEFHDSVPEWSGIRAVGHGINKGLTWRCPKCLLDAPLKKWYLYHQAHKCGHSVYWENGIVAQMSRQHDCPWCGGEVKEITYPRNHPYLDFGPPWGRVINNIRSRGPGDPEQCVIHHYPGNICCQGAEE